MLDLDVTFAKMTNPRMSAGLLVLHALLDEIRGDPLEPKKVREKVDMMSSSRRFSKQSITNAARRLKDAGMIERTENKYSVKYGYLLSVLLDTVINLNDRVSELEDEVAILKAA
ncbi:MAG: hypothetical protein ACP6KW_01495 [Candidatus Thorarchaeota archaeon]